MKIFKCKICGNIVSLLDGNEKLLKCCNQELEEISVSTGEGEIKNKPVIQVEDNQAYIRVGETEHPMDEDHYIKWILIVTNEYSKLIKLNPGDKAECVVPYIEGLEVYSFCNKHSLWKNVM